MTMHRSAGEVREAFGSAQLHATSLAGPPPAWRAGRSRRRPSSRWLGLAVMAVVTGGGLGWAWVASSGPSTPTLPAEAMVRAAPPGAGTVARPPEAPPLARDATPAQPAAASSLSVIQQAGRIRMAMTDAPLADAVRALASATHTTIRGGEMLLASTTGRATLRWEGTSAVAAWDALLGRIANTAVSCSAAACELWIVGATAVSARGTGAAAVTAATVEPPRPSLAPGPAPPLESQDTETN